MAKIKDLCIEATDFIESCFDENNPNDGLTFDERIKQRSKELKPEVRQIVIGAQKWNDE